MVCCGNCKDTLLISAFNFKLRNQIRAKAFHLISLEEKVTTLCEQKKLFLLAYTVGESYDSISAFVACKQMIQDLWWKRNIFWMNLTSEVGWLLWPLPWWISPERWQYLNMLPTGHKLTVSDIPTCWELTKCY